MLQRLALVVVTAAASAIGPVAIASPMVDTGRWLPPETLQVEDSGDIQPQTASNVAGDTAAVWQVHTRDQGIQVFAAVRPAGGQWAPARRLGTRIYQPAAPQVAIDARGDVMVLWAGSASGYGVSAAWKPSRGVWGIAHPLVDEPGIVADHPKIGLSADGEATAIWHSSVGVQTASRPYGGVWSEPTTLDRNAGHPSLAVNADGAAVVSFVQEFSGPDQIGVMARPSSGWWSPVQTVAQPTHDIDDDPSVAMSESGLATVVWRMRDGERMLAEAARMDLTGEWSAAMSLTGDQLEQVITGPFVSMAADGTASVVWTQQVDRDRLVAFTQGDQDGWAPTRLLSPAEESVEEPQVGVDSRGDAFVVWSHQRGPEDYDVMAVQKSADEDWGPPQMISDTDIYNENVDVDLQVDASGGAHVIWWGGRHDQPFAVRMATYDAAGPATRVTEPAGQAQTSTLFPVAWQGSDNWSEVASYDVRVREATWHGPYGSWSTWQSDTTDTRATFRGVPGTSYCFGARAADALGNLGAWSPTTCTSVPLDDTALTAGGLWTRATHVGYFQKTVLGTTHHGAAAFLTGIHGSYLALLVATGPGAGTVRASFGGTDLGTFSLASSQPHRLQLIPLGDFEEVRAGGLSLTVTSRTGAPVRIDGVVVAR